MIGPDPNIESFITTVTGCHYRFEAAVPLDKLNTQSTRQWSRLVESNADYVAGIAETIRMGGYVPPLLTRQRSKSGTLDVLDGIHRAKASAAAKQTTVSAYVLLDCDDHLAEKIASVVNVCLNGQGLTEQERRLHFIAMLRRQVTDLQAANLHDRETKKSMHLLSVSASTAKKWLDVELFKLRAERLGLKLPPGKESSHDAGARSESWVLLVAKFTDEELQKYWTQLTGTTSHTALKKTAHELEKCTSTSARAKLADMLVPGLLPTIRQLSTSRADTERREANMIRMHAAALVKLELKLLHLAAKYPDVRTALITLQRLFDALVLPPTLNGILDGEENGEENSAAPAH